MFLPLSKLEQLFFLFLMSTKKRGSTGERSYQEIDLDEIYRLGWSEGGVRGVNRG